MLLELLPGLVCPLLVELYRVEVARGGDTADDRVGHGTAARAWQEKQELRGSLRTSPPSTTPPLQEEGAHNRHMRAEMGSPHELHVCSWPPQAWAGVGGLCGIGTGEGGAALPSTHRTNVKHSSGADRANAGPTRPGARPLLHYGQPMGLANSFPSYFLP